MLLVKSSPRIATAASVASMAALLSLGGAPAAFAQGCTGAPGASAIQQYCEAVPRADGGSDRPGGGGGGGSDSGSGGGNSSGSGSGVSAQTSEALSGAGADGAAVERLAGGDSAAAAPKGSGSKPKKSSAKTSESTTPNDDDGAVLAERVDGPADPDGSPLKAATNAVSSGPTAGSGVVWGLVGISVLGAGAAVFLRRRNGDDLIIPDDES